MANRIVLNTISYHGSGAVAEIGNELEALKEEDLPFLAQSAYDDACRPGNPKDCDVESLTALFHKLM